MKQRSHSRLGLLLSILCLSLFASCVPASTYRQWTYGDLRLLDPVDDTSAPSLDILAVYTRTIGFDLEIRVDLLDLAVIPDYHLQILLDTRPGGDPWDLTIDIPSSGRPSVSPANPGIIPRLIRDPWLDTVTVRFNRLSIPQPFTLQVASFIPGETPLVDQTVPVRSDAFPPAQRAALLIAFWDVFPAATPAQALRRWDGAHTGPFGERHGLKHILDNSGRYGIPVALLDVKTPASLAALNYIGALPQLKKLSDLGLLLLPDVAYGEPAEISLEFSRRAAAGFSLPGSQFVYNASSRFQPDYLAQFIPLDQASHLSLSASTRLIPLPAADIIQATLDGPSLDVRRTLVKAALSADPSGLVVLGGDLPHSSWGNENIAGPTFAWLAAHPWIMPLTGDDLMTFPLDSQGVQISTTASPSTPILADLRAAPHNVLTDSAWQSYFMLTAPTTDENLLAIRPNYLGQVGELLAAARWAEQPTIQADCDHDLNNDGLSECILSNLKLYAILESSGARLTNLFYLDQTGPHQLIGPSSQFTIGLSDPSEWRPELGESADPSVIPGAFTDDTSTWSIYQPTIASETITFTSPTGSRLKTYRILNDGIEITYQDPGQVKTRLPLVVDPQVFYFSPSQYIISDRHGMWDWGLINGSEIEVISEAELFAQSFTESLAFISQPENPDRTYPGGHYLPFPLAIINLQGHGNFMVKISVK